MNNRIIQSIEQTHIGVQIATAFAKKYADKLPEDLGSLFISDSNVHCTVSLSHSWITAEDRAKALTVLGDIFGRDGWLAKSDGHLINWSKKLDGVALSIIGAEWMPEHSTPVHPSKFPLQLADAA